MGGVPVAATMNVAGWPTLTVWLEGGVPMDGAISVGGGAYDPPAVHPPIMRSIRARTENPSRPLLRNCGTGDAGCNCAESNLFISEGTVSCENLSAYPLFRFERMQVLHQTDASVAEH